MVRWTLRPGEVAEIDAADFGVAADDEAAEKFEHPVGKTLIAKPGRYTFRYTIRMGSIQTKDATGKVVIPAEGDWQGELVTGEATLVVRPRTPEDDAAGTGGELRRPDRVRRQGREADPQGHVHRPGGGPRAALAATGSTPGPIEIPECPPRPLRVCVHAPGYEEALFDDVLLKPDETKRLELTPAAPTRFRLVSSVDGKPVAGAKVRFFNKTSDTPAAGPIRRTASGGRSGPRPGPTGRSARHTAEDRPVLRQARRRRLFFYIEAPGLAGRFLGGVKAGRTWGTSSSAPPWKSVARSAARPRNWIASRPSGTSPSR